MSEFHLSSRLARLRYIEAYFARVKIRMKKGNGMSMAEFIYPMLQAWDWWHMYSTKNIQVQIGGSDQFGNILAGVDAINHCQKTHSDPQIREDLVGMMEQGSFLQRPMGFTVPLLTTSSGEKFGKSAGNAVWLDKEMTSSFELYQVRLYYLIGERNINFSPVLSPNG